MKLICRNSHSHNHSESDLKLETGHRNQTATFRFRERAWACAELFSVGLIRPVTPVKTDEERRAHRAR